MVVMFVPTDVPDTCYLAEVAYWLAFGRVPEFHPDGLEADSRAGQGIESGQAPPALQHFFSEREFTHAGVALDYQRYFDAREEIIADSGLGFINSFEDNAGRLSPHGHLPEQQAQRYLENVEELRQHIKRQAAELDWAISMEASLYGFIDFARTTVFQSVASGRLKAIGYTAYPVCSGGHQI